jgi:hypothetical protein
MPSPPQKATIFSAKRQIVRGGGARRREAHLAGALGWVGRVERPGQRPGGRTTPAGTQIKGEFNAKAQPKAESGNRKAVARNFVEN